MKLTLLEGSRTIVIGVLGCGEICSYDVAGLPAGAHAKIAHFSLQSRVAFPAVE